MALLTGTPPDHAMSDQGRWRRRTWTRSIWAALGLLPFVAIIVLVGVGLAAIVAQGGAPDWLAKLSYVGQAFGVLTAVLSALALAALVITFRVQFSELRTHRAELAQQRTEMYRTAEASLRALHVKLIEMSLNDPSLAAVWPISYTERSEERRRQFLYINLVFQQLWLEARIANYTEAEIEAYLRRHFTSPLFREYWQATRAARISTLAPESSEYRYSGIADRVWQEYENVVACFGSGSDNDPPGPTKPQPRWEPPDVKAA